MWLRHLWEWHARSGLVFPQLYKGEGLQSGYFGLLFSSTLTSSRESWRPGWLLPRLQLLSLQLSAISKTRACFFRPQTLKLMSLVVRVQNQIAGMGTGNFKFAREGRCLSGNYGSVCTCISTGSDDPSTEGVCSDVSFYTRVRMKRLKSSYIVYSCQPVAGKYCFHVCAGLVHVQTGLP